jgi:nitroimidazol reductase NimA-like FMN-containing flavoprotein (pyridoxamine 5'-phosphate oxidase superfamily)
MPLASPQRDQGHGRQDLGPYGSGAHQAQTCPMTPTTPAPRPTGRTSAPSSFESAETPAQPRRIGVGDLARRVTNRRTEVGLSTQELAKRAGIDAWFLAYFEQSADTSLSGGALLRLAVALDTTPFALEGGQIDRPPGLGRAGPHPVLESLTTEQCQEHLAAGGVGRIVLTTGSGPFAFPVNFVFTGGAVILRTSDAMTARVSGVVAFEVDHIDEAMSGGWSVLVRGHARLIEEPEERIVAAHLDVEPWAGGARLNVISIEPFEITGRVIVQRPAQGLA